MLSYPSLMFIIMHAINVFLSHGMACVDLSTESFDASSIESFAFSPWRYQAAYTKTLYSRSQVDREPSHGRLERLHHFIKSPSHDSSFTLFQASPDTVFSGVYLLTFEGTANVQNWANNLKVIGKKPDPESPYAVHMGYYKEYKGIQNHVKELLFQICPEKLCTDRVLFSGFSMGGALASLAVADALRNGFPERQLGLITFGSPKVGGADFAHFVDDHSLFVNIRVVIKQDPVPQLPTRSGWVHVGCPTEWSCDKDANQCFVSRQDRNYKKKSFFRQFLRGLPMGEEVELLGTVFGMAKNFKKFHLKYNELY